MATENPRTIGVDRSRLPYAVQWLNTDEGASPGRWMPIGPTRGWSYSPGTDSTTTDRGSEQYAEIARTPADANTFTVDMDIAIGDGLIAKINEKRKSGGNNHRLRLIQKGFKVSGKALDASNTFAVAKTNATGGDGLGSVTLKGITLEDLGGSLVKNMAFAINSAAPALTNLFVIQEMDYTLDEDAAGFAKVYGYSVTDGTVMADPTLAAVSAGSIDYILPDALFEVRCSLDQDIRMSQTPGQSTRGTAQFTEIIAPTELLGGLGVYYKDDAMI